MSERNESLDPIKSLNEESLSDQGQALSACPEEEEILVPADMDGVRLDAFLSDFLGVSRTFIQRVIRDGYVKVFQGKRVKPSRLVLAGESLRFRLPPPQRMDLVPEPVDFSVVYEDDDIIVVDKPAGVVVHPAPGHWRGTLVHGLLYSYPDIGTINDVVRPGIVHRLDSTTSGLLVVARNTESLNELQRSFKDREVGKFYLALSDGRVVGERISLDAPIGRDRNNRYRMTVTDDGKDARTDVYPLWNRGRYSFLICELHSGRTHQIRVHLRHLGAPLVGDELYGFRKKGRKNGPLLEGRVFLHAWKLVLPHPRTGEIMNFRSVLPQDLSSILSKVLSTGRN